MSRDWESPEYKKWRSEIRKRDKGKCQMPGCNSKKAIKVHHILPWAKFPSKRYDIKNGICLCRFHHDSIHNQEHLFIKLFLSIVSRKYDT